MKKPTSAIARANSYRPTKEPSYLKAQMWKDLQDILDYTDSLENQIKALQRRNEKMELNLKRFAPHTPEIRDFL